MAMTVISISALTGYLFYKQYSQRSSNHLSMFYLLFILNVSENVF
jgi:hypothetical protein